MSIASSGSLGPLSVAASAAGAIGVKQAVTQNSISQYVIKDEIKLSEKAISLLGGTVPPAAK